MTAALLLAAAVLSWPSTSGGRDRLAAVTGAVGSGGPGRSALAAFTPGVVAARWRGRRRSPTPEALELVQLLEGLAGALRAGLTPARALAHLVEIRPGRPADQSAGSVALAGLVDQLAARADAGLRLEPAWRAAATRARSSVLLAVAEGWALSERHGAPLVQVLDALVVALRDGARGQAAVQTALAAPRATAALLGVLPVGGVALGELVGVHPLSVLVQTPGGRLCGLLGLTCTLGGRRWMRRLVSSVEAGRAR